MIYITDSNNLKKIIISIITIASGLNLAINLAESPEAVKQMIKPALIALNIIYKIFTET
jgi:hypothetical protein